MRNSHGKFLGDRGEDHAGLAAQGAGAALHDPGPEVGGAGAGDRGEPGGLREQDLLRVVRRPHRLHDVHEAAPAASGPFHQEGGVGGGAVHGEGQCALPHHHLPGGAAGNRHLHQCGVQALLDRVPQLRRAEVLQEQGGGHLRHGPPRRRIRGLLRVAVLPPQAAPREQRQQLHPRRVPPHQQHSAQHVREFMQQGPQVPAQELRRRSILQGEGGGPGVHRRERQAVQGIQEAHGEHRDQEECRRVRENMRTCQQEAAGELRPSK